MPLLHIPECAITNEGDLVFYRFIPLDNPPIIDPLPVRISKALKNYPPLAARTIVPNLWPKTALERLCKVYDIPLFWVTGHCSSIKNAATANATRRKMRKNRSLTSKEFRRLRKALKKIDEQSALIISILWFLNTRLEAGGGFITLEEVLRLKVWDISQRDECRPPTISLTRHQGRRTHLVSHFLPPALWRPLYRQVKEKREFVFSKVDNEPLFPGQVDSCIIKAAKNAGFQERITSIYFRPQFNKAGAERARRCGAFDNVNLDPLSAQEWVALCNHCPKILPRKGRKPMHDPRELLNAIFHKLKTGCSLRKLSDSFPPWKAVDSQYRRWKNTGLFREILKYRKHKSDS